MNDDRRVEFRDKSVVSVHERDDVIVLTVFTKAPPAEQTRDGSCFLSLVMSKAEWDHLHGE